MNLCQRNVFNRVDHKAVLAVVVLLGAAFRVWNLGHKSLGGDEALDWFIAQGSTWTEILQLNAGSNSAPPLYVFVLSLVSRIHDSEASLRAISCLAGVATLPAMWLCARRFLNIPGALFSTAALAFAHIQIYYSQYVREYSLTLLLALLSLSALKDVLDQPSRRRFFWFSGLTAIGIVLQYGFALFTSGLLVAGAVLDRDSATYVARLKRWGWAAIPATAALLLDWVTGLSDLMCKGFASGGTSDYLRHAYWQGSLHSAFEVIVYNTYRLVDFSSSCAELFLLMGIAGLYCLLRRPSDRTILVISTSCFGLALIAAFLRLYPYSGHRQIIFLSPFIYLIAGFLFDRISKPMYRALWWSVALLYFIESINTSIQFVSWNGFENYRPVITALLAKRSATDGLWIYPGMNMSAQYYLRRSPSLAPMSTSDRGHPEHYLEHLLKSLPRHNLTWLLLGRCYQNECTFLLESLAKHGYLLRKTDEAANVELYSATAQRRPEY